ncbi:MAG: ROK family protein, partial [Candidatus Pacearchaeota archaeon]|nr:ROK family protein [Candidatus Pacearchaeota archaeon]
VGKLGLSLYYAKETALTPEKIPADKIPDARGLENIAKGIEKGNKKAAIHAYENLGIVAGDAIAHALTLIDGLVVIGGGLSKAAGLFYPSLLKELNSTIKHANGEDIPRLIMDVYDLEKTSMVEEFVRGKEQTIKIHSYSEYITYNTSFRTGIGFSRLGTSRAVALGAYVFALMQIDSSH